MSEKKNFWASLFGNNSGGCCNMQITEEPRKKGGCCDMEIVEEPSGKPKRYQGCCGPKPAHSQGNLTSVKVLGPGCKNCRALLASVQAALQEINAKVAVEYINDMQIVASYGIMSTPALVVNEQVVSMGKVMRAKDVVNLLHNLGY